MLNGVINIYKEKGYTSFDVVARLRGILKTKKIGHTGTLDPDAEGVLPVCIGKATKLCDVLTSKDKEYKAVLRLGIKTDTQDISGTILEENHVEVSEEELREIIQDFTGLQDQIPPMYSAIKVDGRRLYELAREGIDIERKPRKIEIFEIEILDIRLPRVSMRVHCSKGTYIRTLCNDIGEKCGCGGCMEKLLRTKTGSFKLEDALTLGQVSDYVNQGRLQEILIPIDSLFSHMKAVYSMEEYDKLMHNGNKLYSNMTGTDFKQISALKDDEIRVYDSKGAFIGLYEKQDEDCYRPRKIFYEKQEEK